MFRLGTYIRGLDGLIVSRRWIGTSQSQLSLLPGQCVWLMSASFSGDRPSPATTDGYRWMHLLVNNGNAAISSSTLVLADSKFVQQQQMYQKLTRDVRVIGGHRNPTVIWHGNAHALMRPCAPARRCLARVGVSMQPCHFYHC